MNNFNRDPRYIFRATDPGQGEKQQRGTGRREDPIHKPVEISLPSHLFIPPTAQSIDMRNLFDVTAGTRQTLIDFVAPTGGLTTILGYAIFNDGLLAADFDFFPTIDNKRVWPFHGDPLDNFRIFIGLGPDLSNANLFQSYTTMQPGQRLKIDAENRAAVDTSMGARVVAYVDKTQPRDQRRFGG